MIKTAYELALEAIAELEDARKNPNKPAGWIQEMELDLIEIEHQKKEKQND